MTAKALSFNKTGYDPFIDFLKAYSIICVVVAHILPAEFYKYILFQVWGDMQVPMFVLIQVFHAYKKEVQPKLNCASLLKRIFLPFIVVQLVIIGFKSLTGGGNLWSSFLTSGGYGPGSYYIWIYLQIAVLLVILWPWLKKLSIRQALFIGVTVSVGFEILFSVISLPEWIYRLLCVRYLFLIPLGMIWIEKGVELNRRTIMLSILSIVAVLFFVFTQYNLEPVFYTTGWKTHRWICYFYLPILLTYALWLIFKKVNSFQKFSHVVNEIAKSSYEIYLIQMIVLVVIPLHRFDFISIEFLKISVWMLLTFSFSIFGGILTNRIEQKLLF